MTRSFIICSLLCCLPLLLSAQEGKSPIWLKLQPNEAFTVAGNLSEGKKMEDLSWAWNSAIACFPQTQVQKFTGNHVLYALDLPSFSEMEIWLVPEDKNANFSIYAYEVGKVANNTTVPNLSSCIRCEVDHKWDYKKRGVTQDHTRRVKDILAINNPYQVLIGVVGAEGLAAGAYTLHLKINKK